MHCSAATCNVVVAALSSYSKATSVVRSPAHLGSLLLPCRCPLALPPRSHGAAYVTAGVAAQYLSQHPDASPAQLRAALQGLATDQAVTLAGPVSTTRCVSCCGDRQAFWTFGPAGTTDVQREGRSIVTPYSFLYGFAGCSSPTKWTPRPVEVAQL